MSSKAYLQQIIDSCPQCLHIVDERFRLVDFNAAFARFCGDYLQHPPGNGDCLLDLLDEGKRRELQGLYDRALAGEAVDAESWFQANRRESQLTLHFRRISLADGKPGILVRFRDVAEAHKGDNEGSRSQERLQEAIRVRDLLMSVVGHDLRTPIFQMSGLLYLLRNLPSSMEAERLSAYLDDVELNLENIKEAIDNLLSWSHNRRDGLQVDPADIAADDILEANLSLLRTMGRDKGVAVEVEELGSMRMLADADMLAFVQRNLINNAIKFSPPQTRVRVRHGVEEEAYRLEVEDEGIGMDEDGLRRLQEGRSYGSRTGTSGEKGIGLGLRLCRDFIDGHGGEIRFQRSPRESGGLRVQVWIPAGISDRPSASLEAQRQTG